MEIKIEKMDNSLYLELGKLLKEARKRKGYSLRDVEELIGNAKSHNMIRMYESGKSRIDVETATLLANVYGEDIQVMLDIASKRLSVVVDDSSLELALAKRIKFVADAKGVDLYKIKNEDIEKILDYASYIISSKGE